MNEIFVLLLTGAGGFLVLFAGLAGATLWWTRRAGGGELKALIARRDASHSDADRRALQIVIDRAQTIQRKFILDAEDLDALAGALRLAHEIAAVYRPKSRAPEDEVKLGRLLDALIDLNKQTLSWKQTPGARFLFDMRLRRLTAISAAWEKKKQWDRTPVGLAVYKYKLPSVLSWAYTLARCLDLGFWIIKMSLHLARGLALKQFLVRWTLLVGKKAVPLYRESDDVPSVQYEEDTWRQFETPPPEPALPADFPAALKAQVERSRKELLFEPRALEKSKALEVYRQLIDAIARYHHPDSKDPVQEARLGDLLVSVGSFLDRIASLRERPMMGRLFDLRASHVLMAKNVADQWNSSEFKSWVDRYHLQKAVKISSLVYKTLKRRHPGALIQETALAMLKEGGKRWFYIYIHGKLAEESHRLYRASSSLPPESPLLNADSAAKS